MSNLWWQTHRQIRRGSRGDDVERAQGALNDFLGLSPELATDGIFGQKTHDAVVEFQRLMDLETDGIIGPLTHTKLVGGGYRYELARPDFVFQGSAYLCWAACLESVLGRDWAGRPRRTMDQLVAAYPAEVTQTGPEKGAISVAAFQSKVAPDFRFREVLLAVDHQIGQIMRALRKRVPLLMVTLDSPGGVFHACVVYGARITPTKTELQLMDPLSGHRSEELFVINAKFRTGFFLPSEVTL